MPVPEATASGPEFELPPPAAPLRTVLIASTPRTGSTLLGDALSQMGICGVPQEYLNPRQLQAFGQRLGPVPLPTYVRWLQQHRTTSNGVFALKAHHQQIADAGIANADALRTLFPAMRIVWIQRKDKARQAVSYSRAAQTQSWQSTNKNTVKPEYRYEHILGALSDIWKQNLAWQQLFTTPSCPPVTVTYEALVGAYAPTLSRLVGELRLADPATVAIPPPPQAPMRSPERQVWSARFREEALSNGISEKLLGRAEPRGTGTPTVARLQDRD